MRILKKILSIIFVLVFVFSLGLTVAFYFSSTNKLIFKDNLDARLKLSYSAITNLTTEKEFTIVSETNYVGDKTTIDNITCSINEESTTKYTCSMVSKAYSDKGELTKTSYFPGDGYRYSVEGATKTKTVYSNTDLLNYFLSLYSGASYYLNFIQYDFLVPADKQYTKVDTKVKFDFNTFSLLKDMKVNIDKGADKMNIDFSFDGKDRVVGIKTSPAENITSTLKISYNKANFEFPSFNGFGE